MVPWTISDLIAEKEWDSFTSEFFLTIIEKFYILLLDRLFRHCPKSTNIFRDMFSFLILWMLWISSPKQNIHRDQCPLDHEVFQAVSDVTVSSRKRYHSILYLTIAPRRCLHFRSPLLIRYSIRLKWIFTALVSTKIFITSRKLSWMTFCAISCCDWCHNFPFLPFVELMRKLNVVTSVLKNAVLYYSVHSITRLPAVITITVTS